MAKNLLYLEDNKTVLAAEKGTDEYDAIWKRLENTNYAHQINVNQIAAYEAKEEAKKEETREIEFTPAKDTDYGDSARKPLNSGRKISPFDTDEKVVTEK